MSKFWASVFTVLGLIVTVAAFFRDGDSQTIALVYAAVLLSWGYMIFNHVELRDEIRKVQHRFDIGSDL